MLFPILIAVVAIFCIIYVATRKSNPTSTTVVESPDTEPSIHEELTKTVEETKTQAPIVDEVSKPKAKKAKKTETPTMAAKKPSTKKPKTVNA